MTQWRGRGMGGRQTGGPVALFDLFSKRMKRQRGETPDVYRYDDLPQALRVQIVHIWRATVGNPGRSMRYGDFNDASRVWDEIVELLRRERGVFTLTEKRHGFMEGEVEVADYFLGERDVEAAVDVIEVVFGIIYANTENWKYRVEEQSEGATQRPTSAIGELNERLREHGVGYQFENGMIMRVDSQLEHAEVVKPVLSLLRERRFFGANDEFMRAHEHHRHGRQKECVAECLKAFESTMKVICAGRTWAHDKNATSKALIDACLKNGLVPAYRENDLAGLRQTLDALPTLRNKTSGHGQGEVVAEVPAYLAAYAIHVTAANILLLVEADKALPR